MLAITDAELLLAHQAGLLAEGVALPQRGQRVLRAFLLAHDAHFAVAHDVQPAILSRILLQDLLAGSDLLHADAADEFLELALVDLAAQVEQTG